MSPGAPSAPVSYVPSPAAPITYQSVIPRISYEDQANYLRSTTGELNKALYAQYQQAGTPAESGARQAETRAQEAASYAASLPKGDMWTAQNTGGSPDPYSLARNAATERYGNAQEQYHQALRSSKEAEGPQFDYEPPSWASHGEEDFAVKSSAPAPAPAPAPSPTSVYASAIKKSKGGYGGRGGGMAGQYG